MRALIVEDESVIRNGMRRHVDWENCGVEEVYTAANAQEAFAACKTAVPDFVISDICMPGMNGIDLCRALRKNMPELEIIFVTGYEDKEYLKAAIDLGVVGYVEKPIRIDPHSGFERKNHRGSAQSKRTKEEKCSVFVCVFAGLYLRSDLYGQLQAFLYWDCTFSKKHRIG